MSESVRLSVCPLGRGGPQAEVAEAFQYLDENGNGAIEFAEFVSWWRGIRTVPALPPPAQPRQPLVMATPPAEPKQ